jgi:hypothetical protein
MGLADGSDGGMIVGDEKAAELVKSAAPALEGEAAEKFLRTRVTLFNTQSGRLRMGTTTGYVSGIVVVKKDNETRYEPQTSNVETGALMEVTPTVSADRKSVSLSMHPRLAALKSLEAVKWEGAEGGGDLKVQKPIMDVQETWTTASVPDGGTIVLSLGEREGDAAAKTQGKKVIVLVKPTVIVDREATSEKLYPMLSAPAKGQR